MLTLGALLATGFPASAQTARPSTELPPVSVDAPKPNVQQATPQRRAAS
jgi:hypothetical protein